LCDGIYTFKMDLWGAGCVLYEIITKSPLFPGSNELDQLHRIHGVMGTPSPKLLKKMLGSKGITPEYNFTPKEGTGLRILLPNMTAECLDLLCSLLVYDPDFRITARDALKHTFFREYYEATEKQRNSTTRKETQNVVIPVQAEKDIPNPSYLKKSQEKVVEEVVEKKRNAIVQDHENDSQSLVSTNSATNLSNHIVSKKAHEQQHYPIGIGSNRLRRAKQKEYTFKNGSQKVLCDNLVGYFQKGSRKIGTTADRYYKKLEKKRFQKSNTY
jgi:serine/threonine protein kinase